MKKYLIVQCTLIIILGIFDLVVAHNRKIEIENLKFQSFLDSAPMWG